MPCMKKLYVAANKRRSTGQQPRTKSGRRHADKPNANARQPDVLFLNRFTYVGIRSFAHSNIRTSKTIFLYALQALESNRDGYFLGRTDPPASRPARLSHVTRFITEAIKGIRILKSSCNLWIAPTTEVNHRVLARDRLQVLHKV